MGCSLWASWPLYGGTLGLWPGYQRSQFLIATHYKPFPWECTAIRVAVHRLDWNAPATVLGLGDSNLRPSKLPLFIRAFSSLWDVESLILYRDQAEVKNPTSNRVGVQFTILRWRVFFFNIHLRGRFNKTHSPRISHFTFFDDHVREEFGYLRFMNSPAQVT